MLTSFDTATLSLYPDRLPNITYLDLGQVVFDLGMISDSLQKCQNLKRLALYRNGFSIASTADLSRLVQLKLCDHLISDDHIQSLSKLTSLVTLDFRDCVFRERLNWDSFGSVMAETTLKNLIFAFESEMMPNDFDFSIEKLLSHVQLATLIVSTRRWTPKTLCRFEALHQNSGNPAWLCIEDLAPDGNRFELREHRQHKVVTGLLD